jgi:hypothetical protein
MIANDRMVVQTTDALLAGLAVAANIVVCGHLFSPVASVPAAKVDIEPSSTAICVPYGFKSSRPGCIAPIATTTKANYGLGGNWLAQNGQRVQLLQG